VADRGVDGPHALLGLQERDTELDQLRHRRAHLPARVQLDVLTAELATLEADAAVVRAERDELNRRQAALEAELADTEKRLTDLDRRMRSGAVTASRDLQAMADQLESLRRRRGDLEDADLEIMEAVDPLDARLAELDGRRASVDGDAARLRAEVAESTAAIDADLATATGARAVAAAMVPAELLARYERLRGRLGGVGAAALVGSSCGGCHLTLSAGELDRIRRLPPDAVVTCEQCGRILVH